VSLHVERLGAGRPTLAFVHGFTQTGRSWLQVAAELTPDHEVLVVDAPGHGGSSAVDADLVSGAELLGAAAGRATYVGYSMGGRLCLHLALARPDLVEALVLVGATAGIEDAGERAARRAADEALAADLEHGGLDAFLDRWLANPLFAGLDPSAAGVDDRRRNTVPGLATSLRRAGTGTQEPLWDRLGELAMPVLVVAGEHDEKFAALGRRMAAAIGSKATFATVPRAGHAAHLERPPAFVAILLGWLAEAGGT
jgi:2-succinyl-6-hydroxy-2,4-cyclohexadiene-1-carboxylate synthase